jgi:biotin carboxyl carrier protein
MIVESGGTRYRVEVQAGRVVVDGRAFAVESAGAIPVFQVRVGDRTEILHAVAEGETLHLFWQGRAYRLVREAARAPRAVAGSLEAPMPGKVIAVSVAVGDPVAQGQGLVIVEAMKMETVLRAPRDGRVRAVHVAAGDRVAPGVVLVELE